MDSNTLMSLILAALPGLITGVAAGIVAIIAAFRASTLHAENLERIAAVDKANMEKIADLEKLVAEHKAVCDARKKSETETKQ